MNESMESNYEEYRQYRPISTDTEVVAALPQRAQT